MNRQEIFDTVVRHLQKQGEPAFFREEAQFVPQCLYRTPAGLKCAIGCLIPDEVYDPTMESWFVDQLIEKNFDLPDYFCEENAELLGWLQIAHDNWAERILETDCSPELLIPRLRDDLVKVAEQEGLAADVVYESC